MKTVLAKFLRPSHWKSCSLIQEELLKLYPSAHFWYQDEGSPLPKGTRELILADHRWLSEEGKVGLREFLKVSPLRIKMYLYGDFTLKIREFLSLWEILKKQDATLIVASESQRRLVSEIVPLTKPFLKVNAYRTSLERFRFSQEKRDHFRAGLGIGKEENILGFAGRISYHKGVLHLLESFSRSQLFNTRLIIAGPLLPHPFWQFDDHVDETFLLNLQKMVTLNSCSIIRLPELSRDEMASFYSGIDTFISPSFFHDEDYGLAIDEAMMAGRKLIISSWGGYHRFKGNPQVNFIRMRLGKQGFEVDKKSLQNLLCGKPSEEAVHPKLQGMDEEERAFVQGHDKFLRAPDGGFNHCLYRKIYSAYLS